MQDTGGLLERPVVQGPCRGIPGEDWVKTSAESALGGVMGGRVAVGPSDIG